MGNIAPIALKFKYNIKDLSFPGLTVSANTYTKQYLRLHVFVRHNHIYVHKYCGNLPPRIIDLESIAMKSYILVIQAQYSASKNFI